MKQRFHSIIKLDRRGWYVGWIEEVPGALTHGHTLNECRRNLRDALLLILQTNRDEARLGLDATCLQESVEIDTVEAEWPSSLHAIEPSVDDLSVAPPGA